MSIYIYIYVYFMCEMNKNKNVFSKCTLAANPNIYVVSKGSLGAEAECIDGICFDGRALAAENVCACLER